MTGKPLTPTLSPSDGERGKPLEQHQAEIELNRVAWEKKPLLREIYRGFYERIVSKIDRGVAGAVVEIGSGMGNLKAHFPEAITTDLFPNPWLDLVCDGYDLPFRDGSLSHLILFDVFHHLEAPVAFLKEAARALAPGGRVIIFDPYVSAASWPAYGVFHHEPVAWGKAINFVGEWPRPRSYYAAQGNATRLFFSTRDWLPQEWRVESAERFAAFAYLLSGGFSKRPMYPGFARGVMEGLDAALSFAPSLFGGRCLVTLKRA